MHSSKEHLSVTEYIRINASAQRMFASKVRHSLSCNINEHPLQGRVNINVKSNVVAIRSEVVDYMNTDPNSVFDRLLNTVQCDEAEDA